ncbi:MAG TPA: HAD-IC family P-type ATPase, partial [Clostridia bacterium]|nr:HAD-IC family P-type ATPase [Clostridia bacterium]
MIKITPLTSGLTAAQAKVLLQKHGRNEIKKQKGFSTLKLLLAQFKSPLVYILVLAAGATIFVREFTDAVVILAAVLINTILGFYQEKKAQKTLEALSALIVHQVEVIRDGGRKTIKASQIVPGDVVVLTWGDWIPADGVLLQATDFSANEAILTGESMSVVKKAYRATKKLPEWARIPKLSRVFGGTTVAAGKAEMLVVRTGAQTEIGRIGRKLGQLQEEKTPLQQQIAKVARVLAIVVGVLSLLIFGLGKFLGYETLEIFVTSVAVAVAAIPEGLVVTLTVILALGMQNILRRKA